MITLVFDTETTGKADFKLPHWDACQPDVIQFGMSVFEDRYPVFQLSCLVNHKRPIVIDPEAQSVHGITLEACLKHGWSEKYLREEIEGWFECADRVVGHNLSFDLKMMRTFFSRERFKGEFLYRGQEICTMHSTTRILCLPQPSGRKGNKWPKLTEAYEGLVNPAGFGGAHNALADVNACAEILWKLEDTGAMLYNEKNQAII